MDRTYDIFVPGRVCLFGEHSDWAGAYRRFNSALEPGQVIIAGTNQGIHAKARHSKGRFVFRSCLPDGSTGPHKFPRAVYCKSNRYIKHGY